MKPRIVKNNILEQHRFPTAALQTGTGSDVQTTENGGLTGVIDLISGSSGRSCVSNTLVLAAGQWYCMSFEVVSFSGLTTSNSGFLFTVAPDTGDSIIGEADIVAGGVGRYACVFMDTVGASLIYRLGVGPTSNATGKQLQIKNIMWEPIDISAGGYPSEYTYPQYPIAFNRSNFTAIGANQKVTDSFGPSYEVDKGSAILIFGDSRSDGNNDIGEALSLAMGINGASYTHASGGWKTSDIIGPTVFGTFSNDIDKALAGTLLRRTFSTGGDEQQSDYQPNQLAPDVVVLCNTGVNDISVGTADNLTIDSAMENIVVICDKIVASGKTPALTEITPWNANAGFSETNGDQIQTWGLNRRIKEYALAKGYIFIPLYSQLADSTDPDKLSDGLGTTPNYSADGLHLSIEGARRVAGEVLTRIQLWRQELEIA